MENLKKIEHWILNDAERMNALEIASGLMLPDWCLAAGFVRNVVWDKIHCFSKATALNDIDLIYFCNADCSPERDLELESELMSHTDLPWSVKNQARMHIRDGDKPYQSTSDAMKHWVEVEIAVGARLLTGCSLKIAAPFGVDSLMDGFVTLNEMSPKPLDFTQRVFSKSWLQKWPKLHIVDLE